ncbi:MAG: metal-sensitive transcriptional regulator [Armatimonadota bacterium]
MTAEDDRASREAIINRLSRIEGQIRGVSRMLREDRDAVDVLMQLSSIMAATRRTGAAITSYYVQQLVTDASDIDTDTVRRLHDIIDAYAKLS